MRTWLSSWDHATHTHIHLHRDQYDSSQGTIAPTSKAPISCSRRTALATETSGGGSTALFRNSATLLCEKAPPSSIFTCNREGSLLQGSQQTAHSR